MGNKKIAALCLLLVPLFALAQNSISLTGKWNFAMDSNDVGIKEKWFNKKFTETVLLPGSMLTNNKGNEVTIATKFTGSIYDSSWYFMPRLAIYRQPDNLHFPFWLTPNKYYVGPAWYSKEITVPANWSQQRIMLFLERVHTISTVWIDDQLIGTQNSLATAHEFDLSNFIKPGKHTITIRIDNRITDMNVGPDSHSVTDHTQGNWNGIIGKMELKATPVVFIKDVQVYPDIDNKTAKVLVNVSNTSTGNTIINISLAAKAFNTKIQHQVPVVNKSFSISCFSSSSY